MIETHIQIEGMACEMCEAHIRDILRKNFPHAEKIRADHKTGSARAVAAAPLVAQTIKDEIAKSGYSVTSVRHELYTETGLLARISALFNRS